MKLVFKTVARKLKYGKGLRNLIQNLFQIPSGSIIGDTYSKLCKLNDKVEFLFLAEKVTVFDASSFSNDYEEAGYEEPLAYVSLKAYRLVGAEVSMATGMININKRLFLSDLTIGGGLVMTDPPLPSMKMNNTIYPATERNFYHFITDDLYNILKFREQSLNFSVVYANAFNEWKDEVLDYFAPDVPRIPVGRFKKIRSDYILKCSKERAGYIHPGKILYLRKYFLAGGVNQSPSCDVYVSRRSAPSRNYSNEASIEKDLENIGIVIFNPDDATFRQQLEVFR